MKLTKNNIAALRYIYETCGSGKKVLTSRQVGNAIGATKITGKNNIKKLEDLGLINTGHRYGYNDKLPLLFSVTKLGRDYIKRQGE